MSVTNKIKSLLSIKGRKNIELAAYLGISPQSMQNKLSRGSFSAEDLIKIADFLECPLCFEISDSQKIVLDTSDIRKSGKNFHETLNEQLKDPVFKKEYERAASEFQNI